MSIIFFCQPVTKYIFPVFYNFERRSFPGPSIVNGNLTYPSTKIIKNQGERSSFCDLLKLGNDYRHLQNRSIWNLCFIFETFHSSKEHLDSSGALTSLGKLNAHRWSEAVKSVHVVFPSEKQAYNVRHARHPHYQCLFSSFLEFISKPLHGDFELRICWPNEDHHSDEISIHNGLAASKFVDAIDWSAIGQRIITDSRVDRSAGGAARQSPGNSVDYGYTTSQSTSRKNSESGHAKPAMKNNTRLPEIKRAFVTISDLAQDFRPRWRPGGDPFEYMDETTRFEFAQAIHERNFLESLHPAVTTIDRQCGCHNDNHVNSNILSDVYCLSIVVDEQRLSINAQQRKSIDDYKLRTSDQGELLFTLEKIYESIPNARRVIGHHLHDGERVTYVPGFASIRNACNLEPLSYSMPVIESCARLAVRFKLNCLELMSLQLAAQFIPNTTLFHSVACRIFLELPTDRVLPPHFRNGFGFGYYVMKIMIDEFLAYRESGRPQPFFRYNSYRLPVAPTRQQWEDKCALNMWFSLHVFSVFPKPASAKQRENQYATIASRLSEMWEGFGTLAVTHSILQKCLLGLLPCWCMELAIVNSESKAIRFFNHEFRMGRKIKGTETQRFVRTISTRFELKYHTPFPVRLLENFFCKAYRELARLLALTGSMTRAVEMIGHSDTEEKFQFCDLLMPGQLLFKTSRLGLIVIFKDGATKMLDSGAIFERMPFGSELLGMEEIAREMRMATKAIPSDTRMTGTHFDRRLSHPVQTIEVDFEFPALPQLDETGKRRARRALGRYLPGMNQMTKHRADIPRKPR